MVKCIFGPEELTSDTKPEHILHNALGGRKTSRCLICSAHNNTFGSTIDKEIATQVEVIRNMLQLDSGSGNAPPMLKGIKSGADTINFRNDGIPELAGKPFTIIPRADGTAEVQIMARSEEHLAQLVPHIAAQLKCSEDYVRETLAAGTASIISKRPDGVHHPLSFGGMNAVRSIAKSCLELWATVVGNDEVRSAPYAEAREFVLTGTEAFNKNRTHLDSRFLPYSEQLKQQFGPLFNLIYVISDDAGRVVGHFTLYNMIGWQIVLAQDGGLPNLRVGLISNSLDPVVWSDSIAEKIDIPFDWVNNPDYSDELKRSRDRFISVAQAYHEGASRRELERIVDDVFNEHGFADDTAITDQQMQDRIITEISRRAASMVVNVPYEKALSPAEIKALLNKSKN
jgi:hypothetical protein